MRGIVSPFDAGLFVMVVGFAGTWFVLYHYGMTTSAWALAHASLAGAALAAT